MAIRKAIAAACCLALATGAGGAQDAGGTTEEIRAMDGTYEIGIEGAEGFIPLARIHFDAAYAGVLTLGAPQAESRRLIAVWQDLTARPSLRVKSTRERIDADGSEIHEIFGEDVPRGSPDHPDALLRTLYRDHGFKVREVR